MAPISIYAYVHQARERLERQQHKSFQMRVIRSLGIHRSSSPSPSWRACYLQDRIHLGAASITSSSGITSQRARARTARAPPRTHRRSNGRSLGGDRPACSPAWLRGSGGERSIRRSPRLGLAARTLEDDVAGSISDAIDDLESEPDARRAVIAAYARMEGVFGRHGLRRRASETATEYLQRILLGLTTRVDAVGRLTGLFEQAKFSDHPIDGRMKQDAIDALRVIRDDLRVAEA